MPTIVLSLDTLLAAALSWLIYTYYARMRPSPVQQEPEQWAGIYNDGRDSAEVDRLLALDTDQDVRSAITHNLKH